MTTVRRCSLLRCYYLVWIVSDFSLVWLCRIEMRCAVDQRPTQRESQPCATLGFDNVCSCWAVAVRNTKESSSWRERHWFVAGWSSSCDQDWSESMFGHPARHSEPEWRLEVKCCFHSTACSARCLRFLCVVGVVGEFRVFAENKRFEIMRNVWSKTVRMIEQTKNLKRETFARFSRAALATARGAILCGTFGQHFDFLVLFEINLIQYGSYALRRVI